MLETEQTRPKSRELQNLSFFLVLIFSLFLVRLKLVYSPIWVELIEIRF